VLQKEDWGSKNPANYAATLLPAEEAKKKGFTQVLWLDGIKRRYVEEVGTMNLFFCIGDKLITPPLEAQFSLELHGTR